MEQILVMIHQIQLSTFFFVMSHMPVKAEADASASAQGIAPGANAVCTYDREKKMAKYIDTKKASCCFHSLIVEN